MDKKTKQKMILYGVLFAVGILVSLLLSQYIYCVISGQEMKFVYFLPPVTIYSIIKNRLHTMMFLSVSMLFLMVVILIMNMGSGDTYAAELDEITDTIKTPKKVGQSQHGSARWMTKQEQQKTFTAYTIDTENNLMIHKLVNAGKDDQKKVKEYQSKLAQK